MVGQKDDPSHTANISFGIAGTVDTIDSGGGTAILKVVPFVACQRAPRARCIVADSIIYAPVGIRFVATETLDVVVAILF